MKKKIFFFNFTLCVLLKKFFLACYSIKHILIIIVTYFTIIINFIQYNFDNNNNIKNFL